jgi:hypothetical protein
MAPGVLLDQMLARLGVSWLRGPDRDESEVYADAGGEVETLPDAVVVERAFAAMGFTCKAVDGPFATRRFVGRRGKESLSCVLLVTSVHHGRTIHGAEVKLEWRSGERPAVVGGEVDWHERRWPAFFEQPCLYFKSRDMLIVEGRLPPEGIAGCVARYLAWARGAGLAPHGDQEFGSSGAALFTNREFALTIQDRCPLATMTVRRRDDLTSRLLP